MSCKLFYASDLHGSDICYRKFANAAEFYEVQALILGGDLAGKAILPIVAQGNGRYRVNFLGKDTELSDSVALQDLQRHARRIGFYPRIVSPEESVLLASDSDSLDKAFEEELESALSEWAQLLEERLPRGVQCFVIPGNDDPEAVARTLEQSEKICSCDGVKVKVADQHEMVSLGYSNQTPFNSPRELEEEDFRNLLEDLCGSLEEPEKSIFNIHCPPFGTSLDLAPKLDRKLRMVTTLGQPEMIHVGSTAVREMIEKHRPLLGVHGHCHESRGVDRLGRTVCLNAGSEYVNGILRGAIIHLENDKVTHQFVAA